MAIKEEGGRVHSERTALEITKLIQQEFSRLSEEERKAVMLCLEELDTPEKPREDGPIRIYDALSDAEYLHQPVDIETFVMDPYYLGRTCDVLYPKLLEDMKELFRGGYGEVILTGSIGWGKTFFASIAACRVLYELSCMRNPHRSFGIGRGTDISFVVLSVKEDLAIKVAFENIITKIGESDYFKEHFPFKTMKREIIFPNKIQVAARASTDSAALGLNVFAAMIDECLHSDSLVLLADGSEVRVEDLCGKSLITVATFDFKNNEYVPGQLFVKRSTDQQCFELELSNGSLFKASWNHPVAVKKEGRFGFKLLGDIDEADEIVVYSRDEVKGRSEQFILWEEAYKRDKGEDFSSQKEACGLGPLRGDEGEDVGFSEGARILRGDEGEDVGFWEETMGGRQACPSPPYVWFVEPVVWQEDVGRDEEEAQPGAHGEDTFARDSDEDVGISQGQEDPYRGIQAEAGGEKSNQSVSTFGGVEEENFREQRLEIEEGRFSISWVRGDVQGWNCGVSKFMGAEGRGGLRVDGRGRGFRVREVLGSIPMEGKSSTYCAGLQSIYDEWGHCSDRGEASWLYGKPEGKGEDGGRDELLQGATLGIRGLGRTLSLANVVSKKDLGVQPTYDVCVPGREVLVVDGVLAHNSNFMQPMKKGSLNARVGGTDRAQFLYNQLIRRMKSRFQRHGKLPGMMIVVSSKQTKDDFTAKRVRESREDPTVFVRDYATWHVKPRGIYSDEMFHVLVGNDRVPSKILEPHEIAPLRANLQDGMIIVDVPVDFKNDFENNLEDAIRDVAGVETVSVSPFIQQRDKILPCIDKGRNHPFSVVEWIQTERGGQTAQTRKFISLGTKVLSSPL